MHIIRIYCHVLTGWSWKCKLTKLAVSPYDLIWNFPEFSRGCLHFMYYFCRFEQEAKVSGLQIGVRLYLIEPLVLAVRSHWYCSAWCAAQLRVWRTCDFIWRWNPAVDMCCDEWVTNDIVPPYHENVLVICSECVCKCVQTIEMSAAQVIPFVACSQWHQLLYLLCALV